MTFKVLNELAEAAILLRSHCIKNVDCSNCPFGEIMPDGTVSDCYFEIAPADWREITKEVTYNYEVK